MLNIQKTHRRLLQKKFRPAQFFWPLQPASWCVSQSHLSRSNTWNCELRSWTSYSGSCYVHFVTLSSPHNSVGLLQPKSAGWMGGKLNTTNRLSSPSCVDSVFKWCHLYKKASIWLFNLHFCTVIGNGFGPSSYMSMIQEQWELFLSESLLTESFVESLHNHFLWVWTDFWQLKV